MKSKSRSLLMLVAVLSVVLCGCAMARGLYADEYDTDDTGQGVVTSEYSDDHQVEIVPAEEYHDWVEEKLSTGELIDLSVGEFKAYGSPGGKVVTDPEILEKINNIDWGIE